MRRFTLIVTGLIVAGFSTTGFADSDDGVGRATSRSSALLFDNGEPDGSDGYSNMTVEAIGYERKLLDDFVIEGFGGVAINGLRHFAIWNTLPPGSGLGMVACIRFDDAGEPGAVVAELSIVDYEETATGRIMFDRPEYEAWTEFEPLVLFPGSYWFEATVIGPELQYNYWLARDPIRGSECWVNYDDGGGLVRGSYIFDRPRDIAWSLYGDASGASAGCCLPDASCVNVDSSEECALLGGMYQGPFVFCNEVECGCAADLDGDGAIAFGDILAILAAWGECAGCPEDLNGNDTVDFGDLLVILGLWGPCQPK